MRILSVSRLIEVSLLRAIDQVTIADFESRLTFFTFYFDQRKDQTWMQHTWHLYRPPLDEVGGL
jgi:hypothetical protein